jgi:hypothetical protein
MKKLLLIFAICALLFAPCAFAEPLEEVQTLLSAVTSTGNGSSVDLKLFASRMTCTVVWGGTTPTSTITTLQGSIDNSTWGTLTTVTSTASGDMFHIVNKPVRYIRGGYTSKVGGDATTSVTMKCLPGN